MLFIQNKGTEGHSQVSRVNFHHRYPLDASQTFRIRQSAGNRIVPNIRCHICLAHLILLRFQPNRRLRSHDASVYTASVRRKARHPK